MNNLIFIKIRQILFIILSLFFGSSCDNDKTKIIILSKASPNYVNWLSHKDIIILDATTITNTDSILEIADGIVLTGGEDINPLMYNDTSNLKLCGPIDFKRDTLEKKLFTYALNRSIPFIGVCRGMQMMNVANGGTLYGDIPTEIGLNVIHRNNGEVMHDIAIVSDRDFYAGLVFPLTKDTFSVNSWHHQGLKDLSENLLIISCSYDGLPEAVAMDTSIHPFMIGVQFHPERLGENNSIHINMRDNFYEYIFR